MDEQMVSKLLDLGYEAKDKLLWPTYNGGYLDRKKYVTSSEVGGCSRSIKFGKVLEDKGFPNWGFAERGNVIEAWAVEMIRAAMSKYKLGEGWELRHAGAGQVSYYDSNQSGTPDGLFVNDDLMIGINWEVKSIDPRTNYSKLPHRKHIAQVQQNIDLVNACTPYDVSRSILTYIDASNFQRRAGFMIEGDYKVQDTLMIKAAKIMAAESPEDLEPEGLYIDKACDQCSYTGECSELINKIDPETHAKQQAEHERAMKDVFK